MEYNPAVCYGNNDNAQAINTYVSIILPDFCRKLCTDYRCCPRCLAIVDIDYGNNFQR